MEIHYFFTYVCASRFFSRERFSRDFSGKIFCREFFLRKIFPRNFWKIFCRQFFLEKNFPGEKIFENFFSRKIKSACPYVNINCNTYRWWLSVYMQKGWLTTPTSPLKRMLKRLFVLLPPCQKRYAVDENIGALICFDVSPKLKYFFRLPILLTSVFAQYICQSAKYFNCKYAYHVTTYYIENSVCTIMPK